jgi:hypothetical protein
MRVTAALDGARNSARHWSAGASSPAPTGGARCGGAWPRPIGKRNLIRDLEAYAAPIRVEGRFGGDRTARDDAEPVRAAAFSRFTDGAGPRGPGGDSVTVIPVLDGSINTQTIPSGSPVSGRYRWPSPFRWHKRIERWRLQSSRRADRLRTQLKFSTRGHPKSVQHRRGPATARGSLLSQYHATGIPFREGFIASSQETGLVCSHPSRGAGCRCHHRRLVAPAGSGRGACLSGDHHRPVGFPHAVPSASSPLPPYRKHRTTRLNDIVDRDVPPTRQDGSSSSDVLRADELKRRQLGSPGALDWCRAPWPSTRQHRVVFLRGVSSGQTLPCGWHPPERRNSRAAPVLGGADLAEWGSGGTGAPEHPAGAAIGGVVSVDAARARTGWRWRTAGGSFEIVAGPDAVFRRASGSGGARPSRQMGRLISAANGCGPS